MKAIFENSVNLDNIIYDTDSYKYSHAQQYPEDTEIVFSYIEPRKAWDGYDKVVFFGIQLELAKLQGEVVFQRDLDEAKPFLKMHGFEMFIEGWQHIIDNHNGRLPIQIDALDEGTLAPVSIPQVRIFNTDPKCWWLPSFLETRILRSVWYPSTVATLSYNVLKSIRENLIKTDGSDEGYQFKLHDFGARGASSAETAAIGGLAHLVSSMGTDTVLANVYARNFYGEEMAGFSIPATEHSTVTATGEDGELEFMSKLLDQYPTGLVACVSDSYDLMRAVNQYWGKDLREKVLARDGVLVVRPDSGDPVEIVPEVIEALMVHFGFDYTANGYKLLNSKVRVIQGDGVDRYSIEKIMDKMIERKLSIGNIAFGMGGGLLQKVNRDNFSYSMKTSALTRNGVWHDVFKDPITAKGTKTSKKGRVGVMKTDSNQFVFRRMENIPKGAEALKTVFKDGEIVRVHTLKEVRSRLWG